MDKNSAKEKKQIEENRQISNALNSFSKMISDAQTNIQKTLRPMIDSCLQITKNMAELATPIVNISKEMNEKLVYLSGIINATLKSIPTITAISKNDLHEIYKNAENWASWFIPVPLGCSPSEIGTFFNNQDDADSFFDKFTGVEEFTEIKLLILSINSVPEIAKQECIKNFEEGRYDSCLFFLYAFIDSLLITYQKETLNIADPKLPSQLEKVSKFEETQYLPFYALILKNYYKMVNNIYKLEWGWPQKTISFPYRNYYDHGMGYYSPKIGRASCRERV